MLGLKNYITTYAQAIETNNINFTDFLQGY